MKAIKEDTIYDRDIIGEIKEALGQNLLMHPGRLISNPDWIFAARMYHAGYKDGQAAGYKDVQKVISKMIKHKKKERTT